jgi:hypothetical protein
MAFSRKRSAFQMDTIAFAALTFTTAGDRLDFMIRTKGSISI